MASLWGTGWEGHVLGRYNTGIVLLERQGQRGTRDTKRTYSSCLRRPFRCTLTRTLYSTSVENVENNQAQEGGSGLVPSVTCDGNGMENEKDSSVGVNPSCGGQERTTSDVTSLRLTCSETNPLSDAVTLSLPTSCKIDHVDHQPCPTLMKGRGCLN